MPRPEPDCGQWRINSDYHTDINGEKHITMCVADRPCGVSVPEDCAQNDPNKKRENMLLTPSGVLIWRVLPDKFMNSYYRAGRKCTDTAINRFENCKSVRPGFYVL